MKKSKKFELEYYNRLGNTFDEKYKTIKEYEEKNNKLPIYLDNPRIIFKAEDDNLILDL